MNVLVAVHNKEFPLFGYAASILSLANNKRFTIISRPICLAIAFYFAEKKVGRLQRNKKFLYVQTTY